MDLDGRTVSSVTVLVPALNAERTIVELVDRLREVLGASHWTYEIVLIDDGSRDASWDLMSELSGRHPEVRAIRLARNFGQHNALLCGIGAARMDAIVTIDDDLQHPPSEVLLLLEALTPDLDLVYGRAERYRHGVLRRMSMATMKYVLERWFRVPFARSTTSFRVFRTSLREAFDVSPGRVFSLDAMLVATTTRVSSTVVAHEPRRHGRSRHTLSSLMHHVTDTIAGTSLSPLFFASLIGSLSVLAGLVGCAVVSVDLALGGSVSPLWVLAGPAAILWGTTLVALGLLGSYAARILLAVSGRPTFVVDRTAPDPTPPSGRGQ